MKYILRAGQHKNNFESWVHLKALLIMEKNNKNNNGLCLWSTQYVSDML